ncbi:hypothetical protein A2755_03345 [Candidatus Wolfebacteria bacterium RIFCSPHIGHO2_01_FULL_48_22]|uniref:Uncharacterized protein n=2 Tax=Candidatus Wolfeibacteriota TaxID=1752735 RepID=A0A1F8DQ47_9BACT|nr:MAG: hypothetical protein A2755_03345 [Candidatus Wolfebacteria bacterium RIFCSPHIGHO2_01_FULL_48_22]OGM92062.1 MAG: hypothetical protein A2935_01835 [Candidatus Wolfebacteria bacterium RIFCSPLOWO2_01_FULL_47_17b]
MISRKHTLPASFFRKIHQKKISPDRVLSLHTCHVRCYASGLRYSRYAVVVPNSAFSSVVSRNAFRRMAYEVIRSEKLTDVLGYDVVLLFGKMAGTFSKEEVKKDILKLRHVISI